MEETEATGAGGFNRLVTSHSAFIILSFTVNNSCKKIDICSTALSSFIIDPAQYCIDSDIESNVCEGVLTGQLYSPRMFYVHITFYLDPCVPLQFMRQTVDNNVLTNI